MAIISRYLEDSRVVRVVGVGLGVVCIEVILFLGEVVFLGEGGI